MAYHIEIKSSQLLLIVAAVLFYRQKDQNKDFRKDPDSSYESSGSGIIV